MTSRAADLQENLRLAIVVSHPIQYYSPWFRWLAQHTSLTLRVFYLSDVGLEPARDEKFGAVFAWDIDLTSGYPWEVVPNLARHPNTLRFTGLHNPALISRLSAWLPDAVLLFGYKYRTHLHLIAWARMRGLPLIFRGDSHILGRSGFAPLKHAALRLLFAQFSAVTYVGKANRDYFRLCGVPSNRLHFAPHAIDTARFESAREGARDAAQDLRRTLQIPPSTRVALFSGKMIPSKQPLELLQAFLCSGVANTCLVLAGDGPERLKLEKLAGEHPDAAVRFLPFGNQSEMPARYLMADIFILPSRGVHETWGLAINEAMQLGLPCLVSDKVGCQRDLVTDGETGWVFAAEENRALLVSLQQALLTSPDALATMSRAARERISHFTYSQTTAGLLAALAQVFPQANAQPLA